MMKAPGGQPGNGNAVKTGVRSGRVAKTMRLRHHAAFSRELLAAYPRLPAFELEAGIGILVNLRLLRRYIDTHGIISSRGQVIKGAVEWDRQLGRWGEWTRRNERYAASGNPAGDTLADLIGGQR